MFLGVLAMLAGGWFAYYLLGNPLDELALILRGRTAPGFLVDAWEEPEGGPEGGTLWSHGAAYTYRLPDGRELRGATRSQSGRLREDLRGLSQPRAIEVEYLPSDPTVSRIKGDGHDTIWRFMLLKLGGGMVVLAMLVTPGAIVIRQHFRAWRKLSAERITASAGGPDR